MENVQIARALAELGVLLELDGANPFRIRAYENAARTVEAHAVPLRTMVEGGADLTELPSIGKDIAALITELVETGQTTLYGQLTKKIPPSLIELTRLPGLGAKRVKRLWEELGVRTVDDLERAAQRDEVARLDGFGAKSQQKILQAIESYRRYQGRMKLSDADELIAPLVAHLRADRSVQRIEVAGSYRRRRETVGDLDLLVIATKPERVMRRFTEYGEVTRIEAAGETKGSVMLRAGIRVDLRILSPENYGAALQYFTGSKEHNVKLRKRAVRLGLRVSEYGVFQADGGAGSERDGEDASEAGQRIAGESEEEVYAALDLPWIPPELREDRGELRAAEAGTLPELIALDDIRGDLQMHSTWSDGRNSLEEMLEACAARGYEYFAITDHSKSLAMTGGLDAKKLRAQWQEIADVAERHPEIRLLKGMEVDILGDGSLDLEDELLAELDVVLVSVHSKFDLPAAKQTARIIKALKHPEVDILAHPTGRLIARRDPMEFDLEAVLTCAAEHGIIVELNAHPDRLDLKDTHLIRAKELGLKFAIDTDAHRTTDLALMRYGVEQARRAWLTKADVVNTLALKRFLRSLAGR